MKYQTLLVDHAGVLKERDAIQAELRSIMEGTKKHEEDAKAAQSILNEAKRSWEVQEQALRREVDDMRTR